MKAALDAWFDEVRKARWSGAADVKRSYATASIVSADRIVFNIKGNDYRLVVAADFDKGGSGGALRLRSGAYSAVQGSMPSADRVSTFQQRHNIEEFIQIRRDMLRCGAQWDSPGCSQVQVITSAIAPSSSPRAVVVMDHQSAFKGTPIDTQFVRLDAGQPHRFAASIVGGAGQ